MRRSMLAVFLTPLLLAACGGDERPIVVNPQPVVVNPQAPSGPTVVVPNARLCPTGSIC